ncbi:hypothetical protein Godav_028210 [Gossypium davidsonii]|uniref:RNase H type-1 domain-containing protein n=1 Tax=Gossypium davidsonii TaxID=34287 RepID=A0A7J8RYN3_GOSDV|nr:hypothetical protein [Gossypium davidsonii]
MSYLSQSSQGIQSLATTLATCWSPPDHGWIKMNSDGVVSMNDDNASIGGLFKDVNDHWLFGD